MTSTAETASQLGGAAPYAGSRVPRVEDARLLSGRGIYVDDIERPGMLHCSFVRSPYARARIVSIDVTEAATLPGVSAVFVGADLNALSVLPIPEPTSAYALVDTPWAPLTVDEARFVGDPIALIVADNRYIAEDAMELVDVEYDALPAVVVLRGGRRPGLVRSRRTSARTPPASSPSTSRRPTRSSTRRPTSSNTRSISRPTPPCRWRPAAWWSTRAPPTR